MAIQSKRNFLGAMRVDVSMLNLIEDGVVSDFSTLVNSVLTSGDSNIQTYVVRGFGHTGTTRSTFTITLADSVFLSQNSQRTMFAFPADTATVTPFLNAVPNTYYWGFRVVESDAAVQQFAFKDPITNVEYNKQVPTAKELAYLEPYSDTEGTRSDVTFIYKVTVSGDTVTVNGLADIATNKTEYFLTFNGNHYDSLTEWAAAVQQAGSTVAMGGDVSGQSDDATVEKIQNVDFDSTAPTDKQIPVYVDASSKWVPTTITLDGDVSGAFGSTQVDGLQGKAFDGTPTDGQVPVYSTDDGGKWVFGASNAVASATYYVATDGSDTTGNGSLTAPFATISKAQDEADGLTGDVFAAIELLPGTYVEDVVIYRHNTILRGLQASNKGLSHKIIGSVTVDCTTATQKNNDVVAIQGLFIQPPSSSTDAAVKVTGSGLFSVLVDNCYLTTLNGDGSANALWVDNANVVRVRVVVSNSVLTIQGGGPDIVYFEHGDCRINSCELYFGSDVALDTVSGAIVIDNGATLFADRLLIDVSSINEAVHVTGGTNWPKLTLSNSSINNRYNGTVSHCIYMDISSPATPALFSWQNAFTTRHASASAIINNTGTTPAVVIHGQTTFVPNVIGTIYSNVTNCTLSPMKEMHGDLIIPSKKAATGTYALTIDTNGNVGSQVFPSGAVASVGNASTDTSITVAGTGSGPYTGAVTVKLPSIITAGGPIGSNGVTIPIITYDKYGRLTTVTSSPLNIEYTTGNYKTVKSYVDDLAFGLSGKDPVAAATTAPLADAYDVLNSGQTLRKTTNGALGTIDGVTPTVGMRLLIKDELAAGNFNYNNGIYVVTTVGDGSNKWQLDRSTDANSPTSLCGSLVPVSVVGINTNGGTLWTFAKNPTGFTIGSSAVTFTQIKGVTADATTSAKGVVQLAGALGGTGTTAAAPVVALGTDGNFSGVLSLAKVKGPSSAKAIGISTTADTWSATGLTGTGNLVGFISDGTPTAITLGTNLSLSGSTLNAVLSGVVSSIASAGGTITVSPSTGAVDISLPQSVATTATPTFRGLSINGSGTPSAVALGVGTGTNRISTLDMNTSSTWTGVFGAAVNLNSTTGFHINTDSINGGNVNLSKSGFTTTIGGNLTATNAATVTLGNVSTTTTVNGVVKLPDVYNATAQTKILTVGSDGMLGASASISASVVNAIPYDISGEVFGKPPANSVVYHFRAVRDFKISYSDGASFLKSGIACDTASATSMEGNKFSVFKVVGGVTGTYTLLFKFFFATSTGVSAVSDVSTTAGDWTIVKGQDVFIVSPPTQDTSLSNVRWTIAGVVA
jgi:hypothetical protein